MDDASDTPPATAPAVLLDHLLEAIVEASPTAIVATDLGGRVTLWSPAAERMFGWRASEVVGRELPSVPDDGRELYASCRARALRGERASGFVTSRRRKDGTMLEVSLSWAPLLDPLGGVCGIVSAIVDETERSEAETALRTREERLWEAQRVAAVGALAGGLAHDFGNLLHVIRGYGEMLLARFAEDEDVASPLRSIAAAAAHGEALTARLVQLARAPADRHGVVDVRTVIHETEDLLVGMLGAAVRLRIRVAERPLPVRADPLQLQQVLVNLALNARDAMPRGGELVVEARPDREPGRRPGKEPVPRVRLSVADSGHGMDRETLARVFEPFFTTKGGKGTGLGLPTVLAIVQQLGGEAAAESEPGRGTTISVLLPRHDGAAGAQWPGCGSSVPGPAAA